MKIFLNLGNNHNSIILFITSLSVWISLGAKLNKDKFNKFLLENNYIDLFQFLFDISTIRIILPLIFLIFIISKFKIRNNYYPIDYLFILLTISYTFGAINLYILNPDLVYFFSNDKLLIKSGYSPNILFEITLIIYLPFITILLKYFNENDLKKMIIINIFVIFLISLIVLYFAYKEFIYNERNSLYYSIFLVHGEIFNTPSLRSLGLARNLVIINISLFFFTFYYLKNSLIKNFFLLLMLILSVNIFLLQSRTSVYLFLFFSIIIIIHFIFNKSWKNMFTYFLLIVVIPLILSFNVDYFKKNLIMNKSFLDNQNLRAFSLQPNQKILKKPNISINESNNLSNDLKEFTSGRTQLWTFVYHIFKDQNNLTQVFGLGPASDRYLVNENVSNSIIYSICSGGLIGATVLIFIYIICLIILIKFILLKKKLKNNLIVYTSLSIMIFLLLRSLIENSFVLIGSDHILFINSLMIINSNFKFKD